MNAKLDVYPEWSYKLKPAKEHELRHVDDLDYSSTHVTLPRKLLNLSDVMNSTEAFFYTAMKVSSARRKKIYFSKCSDRTLTTAG